MRHITIKQEVAQQLFDNIPSNVINKWELEKPDINLSIFRFKNEKISAIYYKVSSKTYGNILIKYSFPYFKFEYLYYDSLETDNVGRKIERRCDKDGNIESEYIKALNNKEPFMYIKSKSKNKEVKIPYIWGKPYPLEHTIIYKIRSYLTETPTQFKWFHKKDDVENKYILACTYLPLLPKNL